MIEVYQTGIMPVGHLDVRDEDIINIKGGEILVLDETSLDDFETPDVYVDGNKKIQLRLADGDDVGPFFLANADRMGSQYETPGIENSTLYSRNWSNGRNYDASGKQGAYNGEGFYAISTDVVDSSITDSLEENSYLYVSSSGQLTATPSSSRKPVGIFVEYRKSSIANGIGRQYKTAGTFKDKDNIIFFKTNTADDGYWQVSSIFGRSGAVTAESGDYTWSQIDKTVSDIADITTRSHTSLTDIGTNTHAQIDTHLGDATVHHSSTTTLTEGGNLYFTASRAKAAVVQDEINDGYTDIAPSQNAVYDALALKADDADLLSHLGDATIHFTEGSIDHTAILNIGTNTHAQIDAFIASKGVANGLATLDGAGKVPSAQLPSYVDDVEEYANLAGFPVSGETGKIYVALDTNKTYRWSGATYIEISPSEVNSVFGRTGIVTAQANDYTWAQINKATSDIADITNRSHTSLTDIGTNTHAQIDTHIASTANPHSTSIANIGTGTLANLNAAVSDATLVDESAVLFQKSGSDITLKTSTDELGLGVTPTARLHVKSTGTSSLIDAVKVEDSTGGELFKVRSDGLRVAFNGAYAASTYISYGTPQASTSASGLILAAEFPSIVLDIKRGDSQGAAASLLEGHLSNTVSGLSTKLGTVGVFGNTETTPTAPTLTRMYFSAYNTATPWTVYNLALMPDGTSHFISEVAIGGAITPSAMLYVRGAGNTSGTFTIRTFNSSSIETLTVRDDGNVGVNISGPSARFHTRGTGNSASSFTAKFDNSTSTAMFHIRNDGLLIAPNLPTSSAGLPSGGIWNNAGVLNIV